MTEEPSHLRWQPLRLSRTITDRGREIAESTGMDAQVSLLVSVFRESLEFIQKHPALYELVKTFLQERPLIQVKNSLFAPVTRDLPAGNNSGKELLYALTDIRVGLYVGLSEDSWGYLTPNQFDERLYINQTADRGVGEIAASVCISDEKTKCLLLSGQATGSFCQLSSRMRKKYKDWYLQSLLYFATLANRVAGTERVFIPSSDLVRRTIEANWDHGVSTSVLDQFYDRFATKRGFSEVTTTLTHPVSNISIGCDLYEMPLDLLKT